MSGAVNTGGTAFPMQDPQAIHAYASGRVAGLTDTDERDRVYMAARAEAVGGMTLRDYFAAKAMQGICAHPDTWGQATDGIAMQAYEVADAMLKAREGGFE